MQLMTWPVHYSLIKPKTYLVIAVGLVLVMLAISLLLIRAESSRSLGQLRAHSTIIANDIWAMDTIAANSYLKLAAKADYYSLLQVTDTEKGIMVEVNGSSLSVVDRFFSGLGLMPLRSVFTEIRYNNSLIGYLQGDQYIRVLYPLMNIFLFVVLIVVVTVFIFHLLNNRKMLENQVAERTQSLKKSEKRFHDFVNLLPEMVWESDRYGGIKFANQAAKNKLNFPGGEGGNWFSIISPEQRSLAGQEFEASMQGKGGELREFNAVDRKESHFPVLIRSAPIVQDNEIVGARCVAIDISERKRLLDELHQANKMKAIGLMAGGVAHDLNNILSGLVSYPDLLLMKISEKSEMRPAIEAVRKYGLQAADVVKDLLTVARGVAASRSVANPNGIIEEYLRSTEFTSLQEKASHVSFEVNLAEELANVHCSPLHIRKCIANLLANATESIQGSGKVSLLSQNVTITRERKGPSSLPLGDYVVISVTDTGSAISEKDLLHIFEPFYTKKMMGRSGTGLGLAVVWNITHDHDGAVTVDNSVGVNTFTLYFPALKKAAEFVEEKKELVSLQGNGERILVVDDEERQRQITGEILKSLNYRVDSVASGENALEYLGRHQADLMILDMVMDPGMNGYQTYEKASMIRPGQKAIIASGYSESEDVKKAMELGVMSFLSKPFTLEQIGSAVAEALVAE